MKKKYKLLVIIVIGIFLTNFIHSAKSDKINYTALGDGVALGLTPYNIKGISFNDYYKEYLDGINKLDQYNTSFCIKNITIEGLNYLININKYDNKSNKRIKQLIASSDIITIAIGVDEYNNSFNFDEDMFLKNYQSMLKTIRSFYDKRIVLIGIYSKEKSKNNLFEINKELAKLADNFDAYFVDIIPISLDKKYYLKDNSYYLNYEAQKKIFKMLKKIIAI